MIIVYADVLILINFAMDLIALYLTGRFTHAKLYPIKLILSAAIGGIYSLTEFLLVLPLPFLGIIFNIFVSFLMCIIAFGYCKIKTLLYTSVFYGICFLFGGMISGIYSLSGAKWQYMADTGYIYSNISLSDIAVLSIVSLALYFVIEKILSAKKQVKVKQIEVTINGRSQILNSFVDSGCLAKEPITNKPVFFIKSDLACNFGILSLDAEKLAENNIKLCYIPINSVTGAELIIGIFTEKVICDMRNFDAIAVFMGKENFGLSDYDAIIPTTFT